MPVGQVDVRGVDVILSDTMGRKKERSLSDPPEQVELSDDLAWRVHENAKSWIVQVDIKSAAALAIEAAVLGFTFALVTNPDLLTKLTGLSRWVAGGGLILLIVSVVLSTLVILPRIRLNQPKPKNRGYLYFGDLRHWEKDELSGTLKRNLVSDGEIASQVIALSKIAWRKHALLKWSLYSLLAGVFVVGGLYLTLILGIFPTELGDLTVSLHPSGGTTCL